MKITDNIWGIERTWVQMDILAGSNIYEACRELAELANKWNQPLCAELNGTWVHAEPGNVPEQVVAEFTKEFNRLVTA